MNVEDDTAPLSTKFRTRFAGRNTTYSTADAFVKVFEGVGAEKRIARTVAFDEAQSASEHRVSPSITYRDDSRVDFELLKDPGTLGTMLADAESDGPQRELLLAEAGRLIARVHTAPAEPSMSVEDERNERLTSFGSISLSRWIDASAGELECWRLFHHDTSLVSAVDNFRLAISREKTRSPIHADLRLDQVVFSEGRLWIVDFEEYRYGWPGLDLGSFIGSILHEAVLRAVSSIDTEHDSVLGAHEEIVGTMVDALRTAAPDAKQFLTAYEESGGYRVDRIDLGRCVGWFIIGRTIARSMLAAQLSAIDKALAGIGRQALIDPESASELFGNVR